MSAPSFASTPKDTGAGSDAADAIPRERVPAATSASRCAVRHSAPGRRPSCVPRVARAELYFRGAVRLVRAGAAVSMYWYGCSPAAENLTLGATAYRGPFPGLGRLDEHR